MSDLNQGLHSLLEPLQGVWDYDLISLDGSAVTVGKVILALLLFIIGLRVSRIVSMRIAQHMHRRFHVDQSMTTTAETLSYYFLLAICTLFALELVRIPLTIFTLAGGAIAIGVGLGSQMLVKNFFSGLVILFERPLKVGDVVELGGVTGAVSRIGARSLVLTTADATEIVVPNSYIVENIFTNWTLTNRRVRRKIVVGVAYGSPTRRVEELLLQIVADHSQVLKLPPPEAHFTNFGDSALEFSLRFWVQLDAGVDAGKVESDLRHTIAEKFSAASISIAFPQRDVRLITETPLAIRVLGGDSAK